MLRLQRFGSRPPIYSRSRDASVLPNAVFQIIQGTALLVSLSGISAESRVYVLSHRHVAVGGLNDPSSYFIARPPHCFACINIRGFPSFGAPYSNDEGQPHI